MSLSARLQAIHEFSNSIFDMLEGYGGGGPVIQIHASLDDVGTCEKDGMSAVVGYVAYTAAWSKFNSHWIMTLQQLGKDYLHAAKDLNEFYLARGGIDDEDVLRILAPYVAAVKGSLLAGGAIPICVITDCDGYERLTEKEKKFVRPPQENSFEIAIIYALHALVSPYHISDAVAIQMDESSNVPQLYEGYQRVKRRYLKPNAHIGGICFLDDKWHPAIQAADMLGNVLLKTWRKAGSGVNLPPAMRELTYVDGFPKLQLMHFDAQSLKVLARKRMRLDDKIGI